MLRSVSAIDATIAGAPRELNIWMRHAYTFNGTQAVQGSSSRRLRWTRPLEELILLSPVDRDSACRLAMFEVYLGTENIYI